MIRLLLLLFILKHSCNPQKEVVSDTYPCQFTKKAVKVDGDLGDAAWRQAARVKDFGDIRGGEFPKPYAKTSVQFLWDAHYLYVGAEIQDQHIWATMTENESQLYKEDVFELFFDPQNDGLNYYEFEINALGTTWDLTLDKAYNKGGKANSSWNIEDLQKAIQIDGSLNNPKHKDKSWILELAIPWTAFFEGQNPSIKAIQNTSFGLQIMRVDWDLDVEDGMYVKKTDPTTKKPLREHFWTWQPHGVINAHLPQKWGKMNFVN